MKTSLYNNDGSLHPEAQPLLSSKPDDVSRKEWMKRLKDFRSLLSAEDIKEFERLKKCVSDAKWRAKNPERAKQDSARWRAENPEKSKETSAKWNAKNPDYNTAYKAKWYAENPERAKQDSARWRAENPEKSKETSAKWYAENTERAKENSKRSQIKQRKRPENKLRNAVRTAFKKIGQNKPTDTLNLLGCTWEEAKAHFERLFLEGMTWENHGRGEGKWQIDHIRPVASFKGASEEELKQMNHISNLQPLWTADNLSKSDKWDGELNSEILNSEV